MRGPGGVVFLTVVGAICLGSGFLVGLLREPAPPDGAGKDGATPASPARSREVAPPPPDLEPEAEASETDGAVSEEKKADEPDDADTEARARRREIAVEMTELLDRLEVQKASDLTGLSWNRDVIAALGKARGIGTAVSGLSAGLPPDSALALIEVLLEREGLGLNGAQVEQAVAHVREHETRLERELGRLARGGSALERELVAVTILDDLLEELAAVLDDEQLARIDARTPEGLEWPPILSPLTGAEVRFRELPSDGLDSMRPGLARELAREFGLEPADADRRAADFLDRAAALARQEPETDERVERAVAFGKLQLEFQEDLLELPGLEEAARQKLLTSRSWNVLLRP